MNTQRLTRLGVSAAVSQHSNHHTHNALPQQSVTAATHRSASSTVSPSSSQQLRPFSSTATVFQGASRPSTSPPSSEVVVGSDGPGSSPMPLSFLSSAIDTLEDLLARRPTQCGILFSNIPLSWNSSDLAEFIEETLQKGQDTNNAPPPCYWLSKHDIQRQYTSTASASSSSGGADAGPFAAEFGNDEDAFDGGGGNRKVKGLSPPEVAFKLSDAQLEWLSDPSETEGLVHRASTNPAAKQYSKAQIKGRLGALLPLLSSNPIAATTVRFSHNLGVSLGSGMIILRDEFNPAVSLVPAAAPPPRDLPSHLLQLKASIEELNQVMLELLKQHSPHTLGLRKPNKEKGSSGEEDGGSSGMTAMDGRYFASMQKLLEILELFVSEIEAHMAHGTTTTKPDVISHFISRVVAVSNSAFIGVTNAPNIHKDSRRLLELGEVNNQQISRQQKEEEEAKTSGGGEEKGNEGQQSAASAVKKKKNPWAPHNLEEFTQTPTLTVEGHDKLIGVKAFDPQSSMSRDLTDLTSILGSLKARNASQLPTITNNVNDDQQQKYDVAFEDARLPERESRALKEATGDVESTLATLDIDRYLLSPDLLYDFRRMVQRKVVPAFELKRSLENALSRARLDRDIVGALSTLGITKSADADSDEHIERIWEALAELNEEGIDHLCRNATPHVIDHARVKLYELLAEYVVTTSKRGRWDVCSNAPANPSQPIISAKHYLELVKAALAATLTTNPADSNTKGAGGDGKLSNVELKHFTSAVDPSSDVDTLRNQLGRGSRINMTSSGTPYLLHKKMR